jgi:hypothetical protein
MKPGEAAIDWTSTEISVTNRPDSHNLSVDVMGTPGIHWRIAFQNMVQTHNQGQVHRARAWGNVRLGGSGGTMGGTTIEVEEVKPGAEKDLKEQLDHLAKLANEIAVPKEESDARLLAEKQAKAAERANQAAEMQDRFRAA